MGLVEETQARLSELLGPEAVQRAEAARAGYHLSLKISPPRLLDLARFMRQENRFLEYITAVDRRDRLELVYMFGSYREPCRVKAGIEVPKGVPVSTLTGLLASADWHEREVFDLFGQRFEGHPNLKRILLPEEADFHPLLKDFQSGESEFNDEFELGEF